MTASCSIKRCSRWVHKSLAVLTRRFTCRLMLKRSVNSKRRSSKSPKISATSFLQFCLALNQSCSKWTPKSSSRVCRSALASTTSGRTHLMSCQAVNDRLSRSRSFLPCSNAIRRLSTFSMKLMPLSMSVTPPTLAPWSNSTSRRARYALVKLFISIVLTTWMFQFIIVSLKEGMFNNANVLYRTQFVNGTSQIRRFDNSGR